MTQLGAQVGDERRAAMLPAQPNVRLPEIDPRRGPQSSSRGDAGLAADPLPAGGGEVVAVGVASRHIGQEVEEVAAPQTAPVDVEQVEDRAVGRGAR